MTNDISMDNYGGGVSPSSQIKAMKVKVGSHILWFSYDTLIAYSNGSDIFRIDEGRYHNTSSHTSRNHMYQINSWSLSAHDVSEKVLHIITLTNMLKIPYKEAEKLCKNL